MVFEAQSVSGRHTELSAKRENIAITLSALQNISGYEGEIVLCKSLFFGPIFL